jgi:hypothetical protein
MENLGATAHSYLLCLEYLHYKRLTPLKKNHVSRYLTIAVGQS